MTLIALKNKPIQFTIIGSVSYYNILSCFFVIAIHRSLIVKYGDNNIVKDFDTFEYDMYFVIKDAESEKSPLYNGQNILVGRFSKTIKDNQDIVIYDKTKKISRKHMILNRVNDCVRIEVIGKNGIKLKGKKYNQGQIATLHPNEDLSLGDYKCYIESDATIISNDDSIYEYDDDSFYRCKNAIEESIQEKSINNNTYIESSHAFNNKFIPRYNYENEIFDTDFVLNDKWKMFTLLTGMLIVVCGIFYYIWPYDKNVIINSNVTSFSAKKNYIDTEEKFNNSKKEILYKNLVKRAEELVKQKKWNDALDFLSDIPSDSNYFKESNILISQIKEIIDR